MKPALAKAFIVLSGSMLVAVGVASFFLHEMFHPTFPLAHSLFHLRSGIIALIACLGQGRAAAQYCFAMG
jgi:hypothetical protein